MKITSKQQFVSLYQRGVFGNRAPTWDSLKEWEQRQDTSKLYHVRSRVAGGPTYYNRGPEQLPLVWRDAISFHGDNFYISAMAPHEVGTIQGELQQSTEHLELTWCSAQLPMRESMAQETQRATGLLASKLLETYCDPVSYDWIQELLNLYPGHVIEFSCFTKPWGTIQGLNTVIWEVRSY